MSTILQPGSYWRSAVRDHWSPLLIMIAPINLAVGVWMLEWPWFALVATVPIASAMLGWVLRPPHVWIVWLGAVVILWISMGIWGRYSDPGPDETVLSLFLEAIIYMAAGVALPLWAGRTARSLTSP